MMVTHEDKSFRVHDFRIVRGNDFNQLSTGKRESPLKCKTSWS